MRNVDLIIIGAGPGGYETAIKAAEAGLETVIVEAKELGGTCLNEGCIPTKCFCRNAALLNDLRNSPEAYGVFNASFSFSMEPVIERKNSVVSSLVDGIKTMFKHPQLTLVRGKAEFESDAHTIRVPNPRDIDNNPLEETCYSAKHIIIATGSVTKFLPIEGAHLPGVYTSTELLNINFIPKHLCVIGGGVIGLEFASIFRAFGAQVTVVEFCKEVLPNFDSDIAKRLRLELKARGITFHTQSAVEAIREKGHDYTVEYNCKGKTESVDADVVLMAVGRAANLDSLNLKEVGIETGRGGIVTNEHFETNIERVYAVGDVNGKCQLAHAATFQGYHVLNRILGKEDSIRFDVIPAAVFTMPEAATVGKTEQQCKESGTAYTTHKGFFRANGKALAMNEPEGMVKLLADAEGKILGCHLFGAHAADLVQEVATLMCKNGTLRDLRESIHAHPTLGEVIMNAAEH